MPSVRPTRYVVPIDEQDFQSLTPKVTVTNDSDFDAYVTGIVMIYRRSTGLMIYSSVLHPTRVNKGTLVDFEAETPWSPPAPIDNDYFIMCTTTATAIAPNNFIPITRTLAPFDFDVKPVGMGPAPAAHAVTHQLGGSDPLEVETLPTSELDDTLVLAPDGAGGVEFVALPKDHGLLTGLTDDDHPQYRLRHEIFFENDAWGTSNTFWFPWSAGAPNGGTLSLGTGTALHPSWARLSSSVNANSGVFLQVQGSPFLLTGGEISKCWLRPQTLAGTTRHHGFHDSGTVSDPVDGAWIWQDPTTGIIYGRTRNNSIGSTTATGYQLVTNTWYLEKIVVNANATRVDFYLYSEAGALLWTDFLTTNIPTSAGRELTHCAIATNSGTTAVALVDVDYLSFQIPDRRPNV